MARNDGYTIPLSELLRATHSSESARRAAERHEALRVQGAQRLEITYSPRGGYSVRDPDAIAIAENRAKHSIQR